MTQDRFQPKPTADCEPAFDVDASNAAGISMAANQVVLSSEKLGGRQRRIVAKIQIPQKLEAVWQILTDYDALASFIPNLVKSERLVHPEGGIRLEQIGAQCFLNIQFCARVVLDMYEHFPHELGFEMVEGDFKRFEGCWRLVRVDEADKTLTELSYELMVKPPLAMPVGLIEKHIRVNLTENLVAIHQRALEAAT